MMGGPQAAGNTHAMTRYKTPTVLAILMQLFSSAVNGQNCRRFPALLHEQRDVATIESLEIEWSRAYLRGDTSFEECLLSSDFTEIMRNAEVNHLPDELALAARNAANPLSPGEMPKGTVLLHGNVAVAYGRSQSAGARAIMYADYYVWENGQWRVYFAQQTEIIANP
jgi:hypothetical protein